MARKIITGCVFLVLFMASSCSQATATNSESSAANISGINHVAGQTVNLFSINGYGGTLTGNSCCIMIPDKWRPGLKVHIEWETDPEPYAHLPPLGTDEYRKAYALHKTKYQQHSTIVDIPQYGKERCGLTVHFLPCNQVKVTTVCSGYGTPNYPIKAPLKMKEPASCPA
ncbi:membrane protein [Hafnia psychrotolerans]|uniref:Membrane protein n=2 Tax=Hafnia psychrotolerans TaxID=1477018 RepID=A0ABQ1FSS7_9GAMM|nr:membrane protein [Hafnia psychrotolerans]